MKTKTIFLTLVLLALLSASPAAAEAKLNVFACEPEWGALAGEIGGSAVEVTTASTARQNAHVLRAKPSLLAAMRRADFVFCTGSSLEIGGLPVLLQKAGGPEVQAGAKGNFSASGAVERIEVPQGVDRSMGDVHPEGNPHIQTDPRNILAVAGALAERLAAVDPPNAGAYRANLSAFRARWQGLTAEWERQAAPLKGEEVVVYHASWSYLLRWLGMEAAASLEPKPGIPPTAAHLESVLQAVKGRKVRAILVAPFEDARAAQWLSDKTGIPVVALPFTVGGNEKAGSLEGLFAETVRLLLQGH